MFPILLPNLVISATQKALEVNAEETSDKVNVSLICNVSGGLPFSEEVIRGRVK